MSTQKSRRRFVPHFGDNHSCTSSQYRCQNTIECDITAEALDSHRLCAIEENALTISKRGNREWEPEGEDDGGEVVAKIHLKTKSSSIVSVQIIH